MQAISISVELTVLIDLANLKPRPCLSVSSTSDPLTLKDKELRNLCKVSCRPSRRLHKFDASSVSVQTLPILFNILVSTRTMFLSSHLFSWNSLERLLPHLSVSLLSKTACMSDPSLWHWPYHLAPQCPLQPLSMADRPPYFQTRLCCYLTFSSPPCHHFAVAVWPLSRWLI